MSNISFEKQKSANKEFSQLPLPFPDLSNIPAFKDPIHLSMNTSPVDTCNKKECHNLLNETVTNSLTIPKDILESNQVECDTGLT